MKRSVYNMLIVISVLLIVTFYFGPILWTILMSLRPEEEVYSVSLPSQIIFDRYARVFTSDRYIPTFINSIQISAIVVPSIVLVAAPAAYAIARFRIIRGRSLFFIFYLTMMMMPPVAIAGYIYTLLNDWKLYDTISGLSLVYIGFFTPFAIWILTSYFRGIPVEVEEAALIDGASRFDIFRRIILPISLPGIAVTLILCYILVWSEFLIAFTVTLTYASRPVTIGTLLFIGVLELRWSEVATAAIISIIPVLIVVFLTNRYIVGGLVGAIIRG